LILFGRFLWTLTCQIEVEMISFDESFFRRELGEKKNREEERAGEKSKRAGCWERRRTYGEEEKGGEIEELMGIFESLI
jgi:hypothetical protein